MKEITTSVSILNENSSLLQDFFKDINRYKIYSGEEQIELAKKAKAGDDDARNKLIYSNLKFVVTCAKKYAGQGVPLMDLIQSGIVGLIQSLANYEPEKGYKFLTFAVWYIRREIVRAIMNTGRTIRYPVTYISKITKVKKAYEDFLAQYHREPDDEELINLTNLTQKQYNSTILDKSYCQSIDTPITDDEKSTVENLLSAPVNEYEDKFTKESISKALKVLNKREYEIITKLFGLEGRYARSIKEIGQEMNLGAERVRQIKKDALNKLYHRCGKTLKTLL